MSAHTLACVAVHSVHPHPFTYRNCGCAGNEVAHQTTAACEVRNPCPNTEGYAGVDSDTVYFMPIVFKIHATT